MFSALSQESLIYVLEKSDKPIIHVGKVESVTPPRLQYINGNMQSVVDIIVRFDKEKKEYIGIPSNLSIHTYGEVIISENRDAMISEIDRLLQTSKSILESVDYHKQSIIEYENILKQLSPAYAKETARDGAIDKLSSDVEALRE